MRRSRPELGRDMNQPFKFNLLIGILFIEKKMI